MSGERCAAAGCGRFVRRGELFCQRHRSWRAGAADVDDEDDAVVPEDRGDDDRLRQRAALFRQRLAQGDYRNLIDPALREILAQAAAEQGLADEIGALRVVLARLLTEVEDPTRQAAGIARITSASIQAARAQRAISGEQADSLTEALTQVLAELDGE